MSIHLKQIAKAVIIFTVLIIPSISYGQKMDKPVVDGFTHEVTTSTTQDIVASASEDYLMDYFARKSGVYFLYLRIDLITGKHNSYNVAKGSSVLLKLADGSLIALSTNKDAQANNESHQDHYDVLSYWTAYVECVVPIDDVIKISQSDFTGARIVSDSDNIDFGVKSEENLRLKKMASLILQ